MMLQVGDQTPSVKNTKYKSLDAERVGDECMGVSSLGGCKNGSSDPGPQEKVKPEGVQHCREQFMYFPCCNLEKTKLRLLSYGQGDQHYFLGVLRLLSVTRLLLTSLRMEDISPVRIFLRRILMLYFSSSRNKIPMAATSASLSVTIALVSPPSALPPWHSGLCLSCGWEVSIVE